MRAATALPAGAAVFDDVEDGDVSDWTLLGGTNAGGGGGWTTIDPPRARTS
ncbi:MAG: hypothetical protein WCA29_07335 [Jiangellales bacterium]